MSDVIGLGTERYTKAQNAIDAMHELFKVQPMRGAVQWIKDTDGRVIIFTRGEYVSTLMRNIDSIGAPTEAFELQSKPH